MYYGNVMLDYSVNNTMMSLYQEQLNYYEYLPYFHVCARSSHEGV
jgi:hypothetical protein